MLPTLLATRFSAESIEQKVVIDFVYNLIILYLLFIVKNNVVTLDKMLRSLEYHPRFLPIIASASILLS